MEKGVGKKKDVIVSETFCSGFTKQYNITDKLAHKVIFNVQVLLTSSHSDGLLEQYLKQYSVYLEDGTKNEIGSNKENSSKTLLSISKLFFPYLTRGMVDNISEERNSKDLCGFPLCMNSLRSKKLSFLNESFSECCSKTCITRKAYLIDQTEFQSNSLFYDPENLKLLAHIAEIFKQESESKQILGAIAEALNPFSIEDSLIKYLLRRIETESRK